MKALLLAGTLLFFWADTALSARASSVTCGATIASGKFTLTSDLDCSASLSSITLTKHARLDLNGHTIFGSVVLDGEKTEVKDGFINCRLISSNTPMCVSIQGKGKHLLQNVGVHFFDVFLIYVTSNNNSLIGNTAYQGPDTGIVVTGNNNIVMGNIAIASGQWGFAITGDGNKVTQNSSTGFHDRDFVISGNNNIVVQNTSSGDSEGFWISGSNNRVSRNVVSSNADAITVQGQNNVIENNLAPNKNVVDLNTNCDNNIWTGNIFGTANQACIQ